MKYYVNKTTGEIIVTGTTRYGNNLLYKVNDPDIYQWNPITREDLESDYKEIPEEVAKFEGSKMSSLILLDFQHEDDFGRNVYKVMMYKKEDGIAREGNNMFVVDVDGKLYTCSPEYFEPDSPVRHFDQIVGLK